MLVQPKPKWFLKHHLNIILILLSLFLVSSPSLLPPLPPPPANFHPQDDVFSLPSQWRHGGGRQKIMIIIFLVHIPATGNRTGAAISISSSSSAASSNSIEGENNPLLTQFSCTSQEQHMRRGWDSNWVEQPGRKPHGGGSRWMLHIYLFRDPLELL